MASIGNDQTLVIILSTVLSVVGLIIVAIAAYLCVRSRRRRAKVFNRGITPIDDEEIASWKIRRANDEKSGTRFTSRNSASTYTQRRAHGNAVIQYQSQTRPSIDTIPQSPSSFSRKQSFEVPQPPAAVLAVAPNARTGLTDETIPGDQPFVMVKRQPSKLSKAPPVSIGTSSRPHTSKGSRSSSIRSFGDAWYGENMTVSPRTSSDHPTARVPTRVYSNSAAPPRISLGERGPYVSANETEPLTTVLSPPPLHRTEIGRAIG